MTHRLSKEELARQDSQARAWAQREFGIPLALEAGAGTGKTAVLISRILSWCMNQGWMKAQRELEASCQALVGSKPPDSELIAARVLGRIKAITFTEAASAEMASRVARALSELEQGKIPLALDPEVLPKDREIWRKRGRALLESLDHISVQTIHSFCLSILSRFPLEAGLHPHLIVDAEGLLLEDLARELLEGLLLPGQDNGLDADLLILLQEGMGPEKILEALLDLVQDGVPLEALRQNAFSQIMLTNIRSSMEQALADLGQAQIALGGIENRSPRTKAVLEALQSTCGLLGQLHLDSIEALEELCQRIQEIWPKQALEVLGQWALGKFNKTEARAIEQIEEAISSAAKMLHGLINHLKRLRPLLFEKAQAVLALLLERMYNEMRSRGILSFGGILRWTRDLLAQHPEVLSQVRESMDQLLVDEFQDTDILQCEIVRMIALEGPPKTRPGLFIVGDPKQSIYGWRDADLRAYDSFLQELQDRGGKVFFLSKNFRSVPAILEEVQRVMDPVMVRKQGVQPQFQPLLPAQHRLDSQDLSKGAWAPVEYWVSMEPGETKSTTKAQATELEARALARDILRLHAEARVNWRDIGILLRSTGDQEVYLRALKEAGIPYRVYSDKSYFRRREVLDAISLLGCVLDSTDQLSLVSFLRSASVGVPDVAWIQLWSRGFPEAMAQLSGMDSQKISHIQEMVEEVSKSISPSSIPGLQRIGGWHFSLMAAVEAIARLREFFQKEPHDLFLEHMRQLTLLEVTEGARYLGAFRVANLERFFRLCYRALEASPGAPQPALRVLKSAVRRQRELQEATPPEALEDAVSVMTIHKAKGLDFSHVYVVQAHKSIRTGQDYENRVESWAQGWECCLMGLPSPGYLQVQQRLEEVSRAETIRTLYVAMTRAKDRLVMAGDWGRKTSSGQENYASLVNKRQGGLPDLDQAIFDLKSQRGKDNVRDQWGVVWRFPALWDSAPGSPQPEGSEQEEYSAQRIMDEAEELASLAHWAHSHQQRVWQSPMSEESHLALEESWSLTTAKLPPDVRGSGRRAALLVGRTLHRALEFMELGGDLEKEIHRLRTWIQKQLGDLLGADEAQGAIKRALYIWDGLAGGRILTRLREIRDQVLARELPVLMAPDQGDHGPVGLWAGSIDLLYRDPLDGRWVIADYKTDSISGPKDIEPLCHLYSHQGWHYVRAVKEMMGLREAPRFELWFLQADLIKQVSLQF